MVATHRRHHRTTAAARRHDRAAHRIPHIHERQGTGRIRRNPLHLGPARADGGKVIADPAALLHGQRGLFQRVEDAAHVVRHRPHDAAVEQRHRPPRASPRRDPPRRQILEPFERAVELFFPFGGVLFHLGQRPRDPPPRILDRPVDRRAIRRLEPILHIPDLLGDGGGESRHGLVLLLGSA